MKIEVVKYTDVAALHMANSFTTGHESKMSLLKAYSLGHSPIRTQRFYIYMEDIPLFCASQFVRSNVGVQWYQKSKRTDRGGEDFGKECSLIADHLQSMAEDDDSMLFISRSLQSMANKIIDLPKRFDRYASTNLMGDLNAESIINMSYKRLCAKVSKETREIWEMVIQELAKVDPDLAKFCVKPCVAHGGICRESKSCGYNKSDLFQKQLATYKTLFS